ncbi:hypothetical protein GCM10022221_31480 [Actinocorallia aurea]
MKGVHLGIGIASGLTAGVLCVGCAASGGDGPRPAPSASEEAVRVAGSGGPIIASAPYLHLGWGSPPKVREVMAATGITAFTLSFALSDGKCAPAFDGGRRLKGGAEDRTARAIRAAGGQVHVSFGGWSGRKLGPRCTTPEAYAKAVQKVIDALAPTALDFDIENRDELQNAAVQDRILRAMKIIKADNPKVALILTTSTGKKGLDQWGQRLLDRAAALKAPVDNYTVMPFNFGGSKDMYTDTVAAAEDLRKRLMKANGWNAATAYRRSGISGMGGITDDKEVTTPATWTRIRDWASQRGLGRLSFWSLNRDRPCAKGGDPVTNCSGTGQQPWQFTKITAGF